MSGRVISRTYTLYTEEDILGAILKELEKGNTVEVKRTVNKINGESYVQYKVGVLKFAKEERA